MIYYYLLPFVLDYFVFPLLEAKNINVSELIHICFAKINMKKGNNKKAKENLISAISKLLLVVGVIIGVWASLLQEGFFNPKHFLYYTIQSNIEIGIICFVSLLFIFSKKEISR